MPVTTHGDDVDVHIDCSSPGISSALKTRIQMHQLYHCLDISDLPTRNVVRAIKGVGSWGSTEHPAISAYIDTQKSLVAMMVEIEKKKLDIHKKLTSKPVTSDGGDAAE